MAMTLHEIREASADQFAMEQQEAGEVSETTPPAITPAITAFAQTLDAGAAAFLPVVNEPLGLYGWCSDGVREKVKQDGGRCIFGWTIWEWPKVLLTAEFHSVWENAEGALLDITPKPRGEPRILFVPDMSYAQDFDFDQRPRNRRQRLYTGSDPAEQVAGMMASLAGGKRQYEERRATKAGMTLEEWLLSKIPADPLAMLIDDLIMTCDAFDQHFDSLGTAGTVAVDDKFERLALRRLTLQHDLKKRIKKVN